MLQSSTCVSETMPSCGLREREEEEGERELFLALSSSVPIMGGNNLSGFVTGVSLDVDVRSILGRSQ